MTRFQVSSVLVALLCFFAWTGYGQGQKAGPARQTWEYRVIETPYVESYTSAGEVQQLLNQGGAEGWELIRVSEKRYYFKRAK
jgi:hypothetical protein